MLKWYNNLSNIDKNSIVLYTNAGFIAIPALVLLLIGTCSPYSWILWASFVYFLIAFGVLCLDLYFSRNAKLFKINIHSLLFYGVTVAVASTWLPGILKEKKHFDLLKKKSIPMKELTEAIELAAKLDLNENATEKNARIENIEKLLRFPTSEDPNSDMLKYGYSLSKFRAKLIKFATPKDPNGDTLIKYGYTTLSKFVANVPCPRIAIVIALSFATGLVFTLISLKSWTRNKRNFQLMLMTLAIFIIGGLFPYLLSGKKAGNIVMVGFYAGLFTWVYNLHFEKIKEKYGLKDGFARSSEQADAIYRYYMRLLVFALSCFGIVTVGLVFHVSKMMGEMYVLSPELRQYLFLFIICHDFYGTMILLVGVVLKLVHILEASVRFFPNNGNKARSVDGTSEKAG